MFASYRPGLVSYNLLGHKVLRGPLKNRLEVIGAPPILLLLEFLPEGICSRKVRNVVWACKVQGSPVLPEVLLELDLEDFSDSISRQASAEVPSPLAPKWVLPNIGSKGFQPQCTQVGPPKHWVEGGSNPNPITY